MADFKLPATKIAPPKHKKPEHTSHTSKVGNEKPKPIQIMLPAELHQEVKIYATQRGQSIKDLFIDMYSAYKKMNS